MNKREKFPDLNCKVLERLARVWAKEYPIIKKIELYRGKNPGTKVFVVTIDNKDKELPLYKSYKNWTSETCLHIQEELVEAYKDKHGPNYFNEWSWFNISSEKEVPVEFIAAEFKWELFGKSQKKKISQKAKTFIRDTSKEIERIYNHISKISYNREKWQQKALREFDSPSDMTYSFLKRNYLEDVGRYELNNPNQRKRNFILCLLQVMLREEEHGEFTYRQIGSVLKEKKQSTYKSTQK